MNINSLNKPDNESGIQEIILISGIFLCTLGIIGVFFKELALFTQIAGLLSGFWFPGYAIWYILYPGYQQEFRLISVAGSILVSIELSTLGVLFLEYTGFKAFVLHGKMQISDEYAFTILGYTFVLILIAISTRFFRNKITSDEIKTQLTRPGRYGKFFIKLTLIAGLLICAGVWAITLYQPLYGTELWLVNPDKIAGNFPSSLKTGEDFNGIIGIHNCEGQATVFILESKINDEVLKEEQIILQDREIIEIPVRIHIPKDISGTAMLTFQLDQYVKGTKVPFRRVSHPMHIV